MNITDELIKSIQGMAVICQSDEPKLFIMRIPCECTREIGERLRINVERAMWEFNDGHRVIVIPHGVEFVNHADEICRLLELAKEKGKIDAVGETTEPEDGPKCKHCRADLGEYHSVRCTFSRGFYTSSNPGIVVETECDPID